jgi:hypothetical protein
MEIMILARIPAAPQGRTRAGHQEEIVANNELPVQMCRVCDRVLMLRTT